MSPNNIDTPTSESASSTTSNALSPEKQDGTDSCNDIAMSERTLERRSSAVIVHRNCRTDTLKSNRSSGSTTHSRSSSSVLIKKKDGGVLKDENDSREIDMCKRASKRRPSTVVFCRRYSIPYKEKVINGDNSGDTNRTAMNTPRRTITRRCSLFFEEKDIDNMNDGFEIDNVLDGDDILDIDVFEDDFGDTNVDLFDDNLKSFTNRERNIPLAMSFDMKSFFLSDEETCGAKRERNLSLAMNVDIKSLFSSDEQGRKASIIFAKLLTEEPDNTNVAQIPKSHEKAEGKQHLFPAVSSTNLLPFFTGNLATYYTMIRDNLCEAMVTSEETRVVVEKMNEAVYRKVPQLKDYFKRKVFKKSQPRKHILYRR